MTEASSQQSVTKSPAFQMGETVYSAVSHDDRGMVVGHEVTPNGYLYMVVWAGEFGQPYRHYEIELSREPVFGAATR